MIVNSDMCVCVTYLIPRCKDFLQLFVRHIQPPLQQRVRFANHLDVTVLDAVVHHLNVVASSISANLK
jgi:hypothetical protein